MSQFDYTTIGIASVVILASVSWFFYKSTTSIKTREPTEFEVLTKKLDELSNKAQGFIQEIKENEKQHVDDSGSSDNEKLIYRYNYNGEELLKHLIKLDSVEIVRESSLTEEQYLELKGKRKAAIKEIQLTIKDQDRKKLELASK